MKGGGAVVQLDFWEAVDIVKKGPVPFVKWAGGKSYLLPELMKRLPAEYDKYFDPFIGGGALFFALQHPKSTLGDSNEELVNTYLMIRDNPKEVMHELDKLKNTKEEFMRIRSLNPKKISNTKRAARFIYLNKTCFRGLYRVNRNGEFNVPYGDYDRRYYDPDNIMAASDALRDAEIICAPFEECVKSASKGDFIYFDPPYYPISEYSEFKRYTPEQFREKDHVRLNEKFRELDERGCYLMESNSCCPFVLDLYKDFRVDVVKARREINLNSQERDIQEVIIRNY